MGKVNHLDVFPSVESIAVQNGRLFQELTAAFGKLRQDGTYTTKAILECEFAELVRDYTGMRIALHVDKDNPNACISLPMLDRNHPFIWEFFRRFGNFDTGLTLLRAMHGSIKGTIDKKNCRVGGIYADIQGDVYFGLTLLKGSRYTDSELAAIMLHELGHLFTYFDKLGTTVYTSHAIAAAAKGVLETESLEQRSIILKEAEQVLGIELDDRERLAAHPKATRGMATQAMLISAVAERSRSETGASIYELRSCEQLADQFATRHGAGKDLVTALDKIFREAWHRSTLSMPEHVMLETCKVIIFLGLAFFNPIGMTVYVIMSDPMRKIYDDPEARVRMVRQQLNEELKSAKLPAERKRAILEDIKICEEVESTLDDKRTMLELFHTTIMPSGRAAMSQQLAQKQIEDLLNNQLFVMSAKFSVGA